MRVVETKRRAVKEMMKQKMPGRENDGRLETRGRARKSCRFAYIRQQCGCLDGWACAVPTSCAFRSRGSDEMKERVEER